MHKMVTLPSNRLVSFYDPGTKFMLHYTFVVDVYDFDLIM